MAFQSFSFDPNGIAAASTAASSALVRCAANSTAASSAIALAANASNTASAASTAAAAMSAGVAAASTAASSALAMLGSAIFSNPGDSSLVVKDIVITQAGEIKYRYSTTAVGD